jgi:hypothetical protein
VGSPWTREEILALVRALMTFGIPRKKQRVDWNALMADTKLVNKWDVAVRDLCLALVGDCPNPETSVAPTQAHEAAAVPPGDLTGFSAGFRAAAEHPDVPRIEDRTWGSVNAPDGSVREMAPLMTFGARQLLKARVDLLQDLRALLDTGRPHCFRCFHRCQLAHSS